MKPSVARYYAGILQRCNSNKTQSCRGQVRINIGSSRSRQHYPRRRHSNRHFTGQHGTCSFLLAQLCQCTKQDNQSIISRDPGFKRLRRLAFNGLTQLRSQIVNSGSPSIWTWCCHIGAGSINSLRLLVMGIKSGGAGVLPYEMGRTMIRLRSRALNMTVW